MSSSHSQKSPQPSGGRKKLLLAGNPNAGKTTVFNRLTGLRQRVGNYPGVTVERKSGFFHVGQFAVEVVDLPGTYSLAAASPDEHIAVEALTGKIPGEAPPDAVLCVVDASNLQRHLFLVSQILSFGVPVVLALNMMDLATSRGWKIDVAELSERLGIPIVPLTATTGEGWPTLLQAVEASLANPQPAAAPALPEEVVAATEFVREQASSATGISVGRAEAERLLFDNTAVGAKLIGWEEPGRSECLEKAAGMLREAGWNPSSCEAVMRYRVLRKILQGVLEKTEAPTATWSHRLDAVLTHRVGGLLTFAGIMYCVFMAIYAWAGPLMDGIDSLFAGMGEWVSPMLENTPMLQSLVVDGVIAGVGGVVIFLPQILILFAFITILEDSGYMARAAFLMDRVFGWCGLNGRSFVPMLSSYACAIPGIMAARTISDPKARLLTILISPLMSCSARLPVYVLLIGAFIEPRYGAGWAAFCLFAMHLVGLAVAIPVAWFMNRFLLKIPAQAFVLEMPPYRRPVLSNMFFRLWEAGREFCVRAGSIILAISVIIWALLYFPRPEAVENQAVTEFLETRAKETGTPLATLRAEFESNEDLQAEAQGAVDGAYLEQSIMARMGKAIQPIFAPAGFDWKITVGVLASFPAREVIVSTLGIIYRLGGEVDEEDTGLRSALAAERWQSGPLAGQPVFTPAVALAIMVFFALCMQCGATLAIMAKETNWAWAGFAFAYMTTLAWAGAVITYQIASRILILPNG
jgi:ferrous iron transport protein B